ncbi:MAG: peptidoglycan-binding domain-containing protein [bacterium]|nr:peptidoglycan-binding domain-containing protein [bacterium]
MANYSLTGYTPPAGVDSRQKVKEYQTRLGVTADGIWGPKTQAAYEASLSQSRNDWSTPASIYGGYYDKALSMLSAPAVQVNRPARAEIQADVEASLRPAAEQAIATRRARGETNMAELDADAASRGMGASTYVTSVKEREMANTERDVATIESNYGAALAERVASYLQYYTNLEFQAQMQNAQLQYNAKNAAASLAAQWYAAYQSASAKESRKRSGTGRSTAAEAVYFSMSPAEYAEFVMNMSEAERRLLYSSDSAQWKESRKELYGALGAAGYAALEAAANPKRKSAGGSGIWAAQKY